MSAMIEQNEEIKVNLSCPTEDEWDTIYEYMMVNNLSSYSNRDDCVDDDYCVNDEPSARYARCSSALEGSKERDLEVEDDPAVLAIYERIAREAEEFIDHQEMGALTEKDKEWIWKYGSEYEKQQLGDWQLPVKSQVDRPACIHINLENEIKERYLRFERGEETPLDIIWRNEMGLSKL